MLGCALTDAGLDPNVIVGATCPQLTHGTLKPRSTPAGFRLGSPTIPSGTSKGNPGILVAEACEYNRSFHNFRPTFACINNVEADHLDVYGTLDAVVESFREFASLLPSAALGGKLLIGHAGAHRREITAGLDCEVDVSQASCRRVKVFQDLGRTFNQFGL
jgi:UDP-N-acetylmuramate--alanine ligase